MLDGIHALSGVSLGRARVHYNSQQPRHMHAHAFAQGNRIHLAVGQQRHLPHEAWHLVQQARGRVAATLRMAAGVAVNDDGRLEREADVMGRRAASYPSTPNPAASQPGATSAQTASPVAQLFRDLDNGGVENNQLPVGVPGRLVGGSFVPDTTPWNTTNSSTGGSSVHYPGIALPPTPSLSSYTGTSTTAHVQAIHAHTGRSSLPATLGPKLKKRTSSQIASGESVTPESRSMTNSGATLTNTGTQQNHIVPIESALMVSSALLSVRTNHSTSSSQRDDADQSFLDFADATTGGDAEVLKKVKQQLDGVDSDDEPQDAAQVASKIAKLAADHDHNIDHGHGGRNMAQSNRIDVTTSPKRTHMAQRDAQILAAITPPVINLVGPNLAGEITSVPMSPGGTHIMSSKTLEEKKKST